MLRLRVLRQFMRSGLEKMMKPVKNGWLTTGAVAAYCGVNRATVLRWIKDGKLTACRIPGGHHRIRLEDFRQFLTDMRAPVDEAFFQGALSHDDFNLVGRPGPSTGNCR
jgi:excisionase family DNA binding protein